MKYAWSLHLHTEISSFLILFGASSFQLPLQPWDHCEPSRPGGSCEYSILEKRVTEPTPARVWTMEFCHGVTALAPDPAKSQGFWDLGAGWNQNIPPEESSPTPKSNGSGEVGVESPQIPAPILQQSLSTSGFAHKSPMDLGSPWEPFQELPVHMAENFCLLCFGLNLT